MVMRGGGGGEGLGERVIERGREEGRTFCFVSGQHILMEYYCAA